MARAAALFMAALAMLTASPVLARVTVSFYSVPGSLVTGRSVHAFITLRGTLDADGRSIDENYGFSAKNFDPGAFFHPVSQTMLIEKPAYIQRARFHFSTPVPDASYHRIVQEVQTWWHDPAYLWDIDKRNCVTFVGVVAQMSGLQADFPPKLMRKPREYLNHIATLNPQLPARTK